MYYMRQITLLYLFVTAILICSSCSDKQYQALFQEKKSITDTSAQKAAITLNDYHIKSQDILQIRNLQNSKNILDLNPGAAAAASLGGTSSQGETFQVENDGTVALTGLG